VECPSYSITEHLATFNLRPEDVVQVVFHRGAKVRARAAEPATRNPSASLHGAAADRCVALLTDVKQSLSKTVAPSSIVKQWIGQMP
jgi:malonyl CoA-acyl carrier protein transacylase